MSRTRRPIFLTMVIYIICSLIFLIMLDHGLSGAQNQTIGIVGLVIMGWCIISSRMMYGKFFTLILMFEFSFYILTVGQTCLYAFNIPLDTTLDLYWSNSAVVVNKAYIYTFFCIVLFHIGTMIRPKRRFTIRRRYRDYGSYQYAEVEQCYGIDQEYQLEADYTDAQRTFGWIVFFVSIIPFCVQEYNLLISYLAFGYKAAYLSISGATSWSKIFSMIGDYFIFSLFMLLAAYKDDKLMRYIPSFIIIIIVFLNFAVGNRSEPICYLITLLWFYRRYSFSKSGQRITTAVTVVGIALLFLVIPIIGQTRNSGTLSIEAVSNAISGKDSALNAIKDTLITMGWTGFPLIKTMELIPESFGFHYGESYFFALLALIPNLLGGTHISVKYAGLPQWLKTTLEMSYGPGYSMPAEAYYNFGWVGIFVMIFFGRFVYKLINEDDDMENSLKIFAKMGVFIVLFSIPRREMMTALRDGVYLVGFLYLGVKLWKTKFSK